MAGRKSARKREREIRRAMGKRKNTEKPTVRENYIGDNISILEISSNAKKSGCNIVSELKKMGIKILEVAI